MCDRAASRAQTGPTTPPTIVQLADPLSSQDAQLQRWSEDRILDGILKLNNYHLIKMLEMSASLKSNICTIAQLATITLMKGWLTKF